MNTELKLKHSYRRNLLLFIFGSLAGVIIFFVPINGTLPFETIYKSILLKPLESYVKYIALAIITFRMLGYVYAKKFAKEDSWFYKYFKNDSYKNFFLYILAFIFMIMVILQKGIPHIYSSDTAGMMVEEVFPFTISILPIGGALLPLLTAYGILEIVGAILEPIMRPLLKLPGKSAINTIASVVGAAVVGIFMTAELYHENEYTEKEALSIASGFSLNSVGYCAFLIGYVGLILHFRSMFMTYLLICYVMAAIIVRIPPISKHRDIYADGTEQTEEMRKENVKLSMAQIKKGYNNAIEKADSSPGLLKDMAIGFLNGVSVLTTIIPIMIVIGGVGLAIYHYTPIIDILSKPLVPLITLLGVPEPALAAKAVFTGGIELFVPSILVTAGTTIEATRYFVVMVTMVQVLYITETMLPIIGFGIPVKLWELLVIWLERTLLAMVFVAISMHLIFL